MQRSVMPRKDLYEKIIAQSKNYWLQIYLKKFKEQKKSRELKLKAVGLRTTIFLDGVEVTDVTQIIANHIIELTKDITPKKKPDYKEQVDDHYSIDVTRAYNTLLKAGYSDDQIKQMKIMNVLYLDGMLFESVAAVQLDSLGELVGHIGIDSLLEKETSDLGGSMMLAGKLMQEIEIEFDNFVCNANYNNYNFPLSEKDLNDIDSVMQQLSLLQPINIDITELEKVVITVGIKVDITELEEVIDELYAQLDAIHFEMNRLMIGKNNRQNLADEQKDLERLIFFSQHVNKIVNHYNIPSLKDKINKLLRKIPEVKGTAKEFNFDVACNSLNDVTANSGTDTQPIKDLKSSGRQVLQEALELKSSGKIPLDELPTYTGYLQGTTTLISTTANPKPKPGEIDRAYSAHCRNTSRAIGDAKKLKLKQHDRLTGAMVGFAGAVLVFLSVAFMAVTFGLGTPGAVIGVGLGGGLIAGGLALAGVGLVSGAAATGYGLTTWSTNKLTPKEQVGIEMENVAEKTKAAKPK